MNLIYIIKKKNKEMGRKYENTTYQEKNCCTVLEDL